ncbi:hypothetical protein KIPB_005910 [Kipferlia bialata]|uniref:Uncharacterized protein n=1 Tax=Kipferlia bialata TaxID=797122 RepID=A0A9K3CZ89_9EUKA|nr:hypothetical protein KIPB_005910 [Kipferlia bialata]|eukprot:g5910.t1
MYVGVTRCVFIPPLTTSASNVLSLLLYTHLPLTPKTKATPTYGVYMRRVAAVKEQYAEDPSGMMIMLEPVLEQFRRDHAVTHAEHQEYLEILRSRLRPDDEEGQMDFLVEV